MRSMDHGARLCSNVIERGHNPAVTSTVTLLELLVQPYRDQKGEFGTEDLRSPELISKARMATGDDELADRAAELRGRYRLSTPDAIQVATAISHKASRSCGNDRACGG